MLHLGANPCLALNFHLVKVIVALVCSLSKFATLSRDKIKVLNTEYSKTVGAFRRNISNIHEQLTCKYPLKSKEISFVIDARTIS